MTDRPVYPSSDRIIRIVAVTTFRPFGKMDWMAYAGCESSDPLIGQYEENGQTYDVVIDNGEVAMFHPDDGYGGTVYGRILRAY